MRAFRSVVWWSSLALVLSLTGCKALFGSNTSSITGIDGGAFMCSRATRDVLLASLNSACTQSSDCPTGAFCDSTGFCNFTCYDDSECPGTEACNCFGQCVGADQADSGSPQLDPACPKDPALVQNPATAARVCDHDDTCPYGTYCSNQTSRCAHDCLTNDDCSGNTDGNNTCDCFGRCVAAPGQGPRPQRRLPALQVSPASAHLVGTTDRAWQEAIDISLVTADPSLTSQTVFVDGGQVQQPLTTVVDIAPPPGVDISCSAPLDVPDFTTPCTQVSPAGGWTFNTINDTFVATTRVWARHQVGTSGSALKWQIRFSSSDANASPALVDIDVSGHSLPTNGAWHAGWNPNLGTGAGYSGTLTFDAASQTVDTTGGLDDQGELQLAVRAWVTPTGITIFDDAHIVSSTGQIFAANTGSSTPVLWLKVDPETSPLVPSQVTGAITALSRLLTPFYQDGSGSLRGTVEVTPQFPAERVTGTGDETAGSLKLRYVLSADSTVSCANAADCPPAWQVPPEIGGLTELTDNSDTTDFVDGVISTDIEEILCGASPDLAGLPSPGATHFVGPASTFSGDLQCSSGALIGGVNLLQYQDQFQHDVTIDPTLTAKTSADLLARCFAEVGVVQPFDSDCIDWAQFQEAVSAARHSGIPVLTPIEVSNGIRYANDGARLFHRLMQQFLQVQSFMASQGLEEWRLHSVLASASDNSAGDAPPAADPQQLLTSLANGWAYTIYNALDVFGFSAEGFINMDPAAIASPDYRQENLDASDPALDPTFEQTHGHDQGVGLPAIMLETYSSTLRVLEAYIDEVAVTVYLAAQNGGSSSTRDAAIAQIGSIFAFGTTIESMAAVQYQAAAMPGVPAWKSRWDTARNELASVKKRVVGKARALATGQNPLGIQDDDTPLFFGDTSGTNGQYFAASDYLINTWATSAVASAQNTLATARQAWLDARSSQIQAALTQQDRDRRIEQLQAQYGQTIIDNCGLTKYEAKDVLAAVAAGQIDPKLCFVNDDPGSHCDNQPSFTPPPADTTLPVEDPATFAANLNTKLQAQTLDPALQLCLVNKLDLTVTTSMQIKTCSADYKKVAVSAQSGNLAGQTIYYACPTGETISPDKSECCKYTSEDRSSIKPVDGMDYDVLLGAYEECEDEVGKSDDQMPGLALDPTCIRGKIGQQGVSNIGAMQDVFVAKQNWKVAQETYALMAQNCVDTEHAENAAIDRTNDLQKQVGEWSEAKFKADEVANALEGAAQAAGAASALNPGSWAAAGLDIAATVAKGLSIKYANQINIAQMDYNAFMANMNAEATIRNCWVEAEKTKLQIDGAMLQIQRRHTDVVEGLVALSNLLAQNEQTVSEGQAAVAREQGRYVTSVAFHYWLDEKIDRFHGEFQWAQLLTYLAMRAVEYEFQQSFPLREEILSATNPDQLETALRELQQELATRTINRRRPDQASAVLSLRDDILGITDRLNQPPGERSWTAAQRFQGRLWDPQYRLYDQSGNWLGQGIPFTMVPGGILKERCGERIATVTATIQGDSLSTDSPSAPILLLKKNTFASQWCADHGDGSALQTVSVQPSQQLFAPGSEGDTTSQANEYVSALLEPFFNVRRADLQGSMYQQGSSAELAGRGIYGDYILLFPKELLEGPDSLVQDTGVVQEVFPLDKVEDVLLRIDYLSVDNLANVAQQ